MISSFGDRNTWRVLFCLLVAASAPLAAAKDSADPKSRIFLVGDRAEWLDTGMFVRPVDYVTLRAGSEVCFSGGDDDACVRAVGWPRESYAEEFNEAAAACADPYPEWNHATLLARVGEEVFPVGKGTVIEGQEGALQLSINDCSFDGPHRNVGQFSVVAVVENPVALAARRGRQAIEAAIEAMGGKAPLVSLDAPGGPLRHFVSTTSIADKQVDLRNRYIDSETIPFVVRPRDWGSSFPTARFSLRDYAYVHVKTATGKRGETIRGRRGSYALVADTGPAKEFGEGSIALHQLLVYGELRPAPPYELSSGAHPRSDDIFHPYAHRDDGDIRAIGNLLEVYYLVFPGSEADVDEHTFAVGESDERSNVVMHGERAATARGGIDRLIACLDDVETF